MYYFSNMKSQHIFDTDVLKYLKCKDWNICNFQTLIYGVSEFREEISGLVVEVVLILTPASTKMVP